MIQSRKALIVALLVPIVALILLAGYKKTVLIAGKEVVLPIRGYDPRDLLSGHYLLYSIDYGVDEVCAKNQGQRVAFVCLDPKSFSYSEPFDCVTMIRGVCNHSRFEAGIEKYFVNEHEAPQLEAKLRGKSAKVVLAVTGSGAAQVKTVLLEDSAAK